MKVHTTLLQINICLHLLASGRSKESSQTVFIITSAMYKTSLLRQTTLNCLWSIMHWRLPPCSASCSPISSISWQYWHLIPLGMNEHFMHSDQSIVPKHSVKLACSLISVSDSLFIITIAWNVCGFKLIRFYLSIHTALGHFNTTICAS